MKRTRHKRFPSRTFRSREPQRGVGVDRIPLDPKPSDQNAMTPDPIDLHSQSTVIAGWKGDYASVQGVAQTSGAIFMGEMRLDANKRKLKTGTYKETVVWQEQR